MTQDGESTSETGSSSSSSSSSSSLSPSSASMRQFTLSSAPAVESAESCNVFVKHLPASFSSEDLRQLFQSCGLVVSSKVMAHKITNKSLGYGFVLFQSHLQAKNAVEQMNGHRVGKKKKLLCSLAKTQRPGALAASPTASPSTSATSPKSSLSAASDYKSEPRTPLKHHPSLTPSSPSSSMVSSSDSHSSTHGIVPSTNLDVRGLPVHFNNDNLRELFSSYGEVVECKVFLKRGLGFVRLADQEQADTAMKELQAKRVGKAPSLLEIRYHCRKRSPSPSKERGGHPLSSSSSSPRLTKLSAVSPSFSPSSSSSSLLSPRALSPPLFPSPHGGNRNAMSSKDWRSKPKSSPKGGDFVFAVPSRPLSPDSSLYIPPERHFTPSPPSSSSRRDTNKKDVHLDKFMGMMLSPNLLPRKSQSEASDKKSSATSNTFFSEQAMTSSSLSSRHFGPVSAPNHSASAMLITPVDPFLPALASPPSASSTVSAVASDDSHESLATVSNNAGSSDRKTRSMETRAAGERAGAVTLIVSDLPGSSATDETLRRLFGSFGELAFVKRVSPEQAEVAFRSANDAVIAQESIDGYQLEGKKLKIKIAS